MIDILTTLDDIIGYYIHYYDNMAAELLTQVSPDLDNNGLIQVIKKTFHNLQKGDIVYLLDEKRKIFYISNGSKKYIGMDLSGLRNVKQYQTISKVHKSPFTGRLVVSILYPLPNRRLLLIDKDLNSLEPIFDKFCSHRLQRKGFLFILYKNQMIVYHPDKEISGKDINFFKIVRGVKNLGSDNLQTYIYNGKKYLCAHINSIHAVNWSLYYNIPFEGFKSMIITDAIINSSSFIILTFLLLLGLRRVIALKITTPIRELSNKLKSFEMSTSKEIVFDNTVKDSKELSDIVDAIDTMYKRIRRAYKKLAESEALFKTLSEFSSEMIFWVNPEGKVKYVSPACKKITGYKETEFYDNPELIHDIVHPLDKDQWLSHCKDVLSTKPHKPMELRIVTKNGDVRWIRHTCRMIYTEGGKFLGIRGSNKDITDKKLLEEQIREERFYKNDIETHDEILVIKEDRKIYDENNNMTNTISHRKRVLVMDDEEMVRDLITSMLEYLDCEVTTVENGEAAVEEYKRALNNNRRYDLIILDLIVNSGLGGIETIKLLKEIDEDVKAIILSGYSEKDIDSDLEKYGFVAILTKPFRIEQLKNILDSLG